MNNNERNVKMKIDILKEKKSALLIFSVMILFIFMLILLFIPSFEGKIVLSILLLILYSIVLFGYLSQMQWYILDDKSVTVRNAYGIVNKVFYKDVKTVLIKRLPVHTKDEGILCLLFDDGREEKKLFNGYNIDNHKNVMVRIPHTPEIEEYLKANNLTAHLVL